VLPLGERYGGNSPEIYLACALEVPLVIELLDSLLSRVTIGKVVGELQLADTGSTVLFSAKADEAANALRRR
jgi:hypothetical protein